MGEKDWLAWSRHVKLLPPRQSLCGGVSIVRIWHVQFIEDSNSRGPEGDSEDWFPDASVDVQDQY